MAENAQAVKETTTRAKVESERGGKFCLFSNICLFVRTTHGRVDQHRHQGAQPERARHCAFLVYSHHKSNDQSMQLELPVLNKLLPDHKSSGHMDCIGIGRQHSYFT